MTNIFPKVGFQSFGGNTKPANCEIETELESATTGALSYLKVVVKQLTCVIIFSTSSEGRYSIDSSAANEINAFCNKNLLCDSN